MQSAWRIACVRIPRFPIAAVQRERADKAAEDAKNEAARKGSSPEDGTSSDSAPRSSLPWDDRTIARAAMEVTAVSA